MDANVAWQKSELFSLAEDVCGRAGRSLCGRLLYRCGLDMQEVERIFVQARSKDDPNTWVAAVANKRRFV